MIIDFAAAVRSARTSVLRDNLATLRDRRDAILAELESISARQAADTGDVAPCDYCGNDFEAYNCGCEAPTFAHFDY